jgi:undecaprenyl-diphosphatase
LRFAIRTDPGSDNPRFVCDSKQAANMPVVWTWGAKPTIFLELSSMFIDVVKAVFLGILEGLTEYVPVSSTGHLLLAEHFGLGFADKAFDDTFAVLIQLGAILALLAIYFVKLLSLAIGLRSDPAARRFVLGVLIAFAPAAVIGVAAHDFIKNVLFNPWVVCFSLIAGGAVLIYVDGLPLKPRYNDATRFSLLTYLWIGVCQCFAMIPGVSRSGATIVAALLLGADRKSAAEFSFYLAMPTMAGAFAVDFYKSGGHMTSNQLMLVSIGFVMSFISGWFVVKRFLGYVSQHGFDLFAWWRVAVGTLGLVGLALLG